MALQRLGIAWLRESDWPRWMEIDPAFQPSYPHWLRRMTAAVLELHALNVNVVKVEVLPDEFLEWSRANSAGVDTKARAHYVAMKARAMDLH